MKNPQDMTPTEMQEFMYRSRSNLNQLVFKNTNGATVFAAIFVSGRKECQEVLAAMEAINKAYDTPVSDQLASDVDTDVDEELPSPPDGFFPVPTIEEFLGQKGWIKDEKRVFRQWSHPDCPGMAFSAEMAMDVESDKTRQERLQGRVNAKFSDHLDI